MARFAPVVPVHMAVMLQETMEDHLGGYHLLLAHDVLDKPTLYKGVYDNKVRGAYEDSFIIMDNSVVELGEAMPLEKLLEACRVIPPDCLVVPDVMGRGRETRELAQKFVREYVQRAPEIMGEDNVPPLMGVLQGESVEDCLETLATFYRLPMVSYISVPRVLVKKIGSRAHILTDPGFIRMVKSFDGLHLLGFSDDILDDIACARMPHVMGIDSAVPVRAGLAGLSIETALIDRTFSQKLGPRGDFWEEPLGRRWALAEGSVKHNLRVVRDWIDV